MQKRSLYLAISLIALMFLLTSVVPANAWVYPDCTEDENFEKFGPRADKILIKLYATDTAEFLALEAGEIDIVDWPLTHEFKEKWKDPPYNETIKEVSYGADLGWRIFDINNNATQPDGSYNPTSEADLRRAMMYCIDKARIVDECLGGQGFPLWSLMIPSLPDYIHPEIRPGGALEDLCYLFSCDDARAEVDGSAILRFAAGPGVGGVQSTAGDHLEWHRPDCVWEDVVLKFVIRGDDPQRTCAGDIIADALEDCLGIQVNRVYLDSSGAYMQVMVNKNFNMYTGGWGLGYDPDILVLYDIRYYWHPGFCYNYGRVNCPDYNYWAIIVESPNTVEEAIEAAFHCQEAMADPECCGMTGLWATEGVMAHWRCYSGGTGGDPAGDEEDVYRCQSWKGLVNPPGIGIYSWWSFLNMYPEGHPEGDCEHMTIRWGFRVPDHRNLNPVYSSWAYDWNILDLVYDSMIVRDPYHPAFWMPYIAKNWSVGTWEDPDTGATFSKVRFTLRTDVCWQDGYRLTVEDIKFSIVDLSQMLIDRGCPPPWWYSNVAFVRSCYILDPCNIELLLETKSTWALGWMGGNIILPKHIWKPLIESVGDTHTCEDIQGFSPDYFLIGSGPWRFVEYVMGSHDLVVANKPSSIITDTIGTDKEFADVHPFKPGDEVHSHCGYFQYCPVYVNLHTYAPEEYEWRQRAPPCTPLYFKLTQHCLWKNKVPNTATGEDLGMLIVDKVVKLEIKEGGGVVFPPGQMLHFQEPTEVHIDEPILIHFKNDTTIYVDGEPVSVTACQSILFEPCQQVLFPECLYVNIEEPGQLTFKHDVKVGIKEEHNKPLYYCEPDIEILGPFHFKRCHYKFIVYVHVVGPDPLVVTKDGGLIEVPNPWICQDIIVPYMFYSTIPEDIAGATLEDEPDICVRYDDYTKAQLSIPDCIVDITDIAKAARAFGAVPGHPRWDVVADINYDKIVDISDIAQIARNFGWGA